jgi:hypothetical protein
MIISASRRTDIPAFYAEWLINRLRAGFCTVPNPFNPSQVARVSLLPEDVEVIVFWTRQPRPLFPYLAELDQRGYRYYFQYTLLDNPRPIDPACPPAEAAVLTFRELAARIGPEKVIWRYDPVVLTERNGPAFHLEAYRRIASALHGATRRCVISLMDSYPKARRRLDVLTAQGYRLLDPQESAQAIRELVPALVRAAGEHGMQIFSCAEPIDLQRYGVCPGKCVDAGYIREVFGLQVSSRKDPSQRPACGCAVSKDIGMYDTCLFGCQYCYATQSFDRARRRHARHDPRSPSLVGWYDSPPASQPLPSTSDETACQLSLFDRGD